MVRRESMSLWKSILVRVISVIAALLVAGVIIYLLTGASPLKVYQSMLEGAFGNTPANYSQKTWQTVRDTMMLLCIAVGLSPAFKMKFWNIGAEGQVLVGGIATAACMIYLKNLPPVLLFICMISTALIAGALWGLLPAIFKAKWDTNETLFTLMMNYVAIQLVNTMIAVWVPSGSGVLGIMNSKTNNGWLPTVFGQKYALNIIIVALLTVFMFVYLKYSKHGYEIAVVGESENTARYIGINVKKVIIRTVALSGAIAGLSGFLLMAGSAHTVSSTMAGGNGFTAVLVSWLAKFNPFVMVLTSLLIEFLQKGAGEIAQAFRLSDNIADITRIVRHLERGAVFYGQRRIRVQKLYALRRDDRVDTGNLDVARRDEHAVFKRYAVRHLDRRTTAHEHIAARRLICKAIDDNFGRRVVLIADVRLPT